MRSEAIIRVLIVDDSAIVRKVLSEALGSEPDIEVIGTAPDPYVTRDKILTLKPDVVTLDLEMPRMDGLTFLRRIMHYCPLPVIVISSLGAATGKMAIEALESGAVDVLCKPGGPYSVGELTRTLADKVRGAAAAQVARRTAGAGVPPVNRVPSPHTASAFSGRSGMPKDSIVAIGASTGGIEAISAVLRQMPVWIPGIVVAQHIPPGFSLAFANRLNQLCDIDVKEAEDGDEVVPGRALIAPGNFHMLVRKTARGLAVVVKDGPKVCYQRPSVDVLFSSVADVAGPDAVGALLTGMGSDGAEGMLKMHYAGAFTLAQSEESCVVFGMPREAIRKGAVTKVAALPDVAASILHGLKPNKSIRPAEKV